MSARGRRSNDAGFTLMEMLVAMAIMTVVTAGVFSLFNPSIGTFKVQPEAADMQQRLRIGVSSIYSEVVAAGAGTYIGPTKGGLVGLFAPVFPYRLGSLASDPVAGVYYRADSITVLYVPVTGTQTTLQTGLTDPTGDLKINTGAGCVPSPPPCGFTAGMRAAIFDEAGAFDTFTVTAANAATELLQHAGTRLAKNYHAGAEVVQLAMHTFYLRSDSPTDTYQLMHFDGDQTDVPVVDDVVALTYQYFGDPAPPTLIKPVTEIEGPWTTYGPRPPEPGQNNADDSWGIGENCVFKLDGGRQVPRLAVLGTAGSLVAMTPSQFTDGPWCPDSAATNRFDADLLRIRKVRVTMRVQTGVKTLRGPAGALFTKGGTNTSAQTMLPDQEIRFDVAPRNLNLGR